jgi:ELWxxDGT repeat protein
MDPLQAGTACVAVFAAATSAGWGLHITDGTAAKTRLLKVFDKANCDFCQTPEHLTNYRDKVYFSASERNGRELFISTGSAVGTKSLKDIYPGTTSSEPEPQFETAAGSAGWGTSFAKVRAGFVFAARSFGKGRELWVSNGTATGTRLLKEFFPGTTNGVRFVLASNDTFALVLAQDPINGAAFWVTDGTAAGTRRIVNEAGNNAVEELEATRLGNTKILFTMDRGNSLWVTDGTVAGTRLVRRFEENCNPFFRKVKNLRGFANTGYALFSGCTNDAAANGGHELWRTNGTAAGTFQVKNIMRFGDSSNPGGFYKRGLDVYFSATSDGRGRELWVTRGTTASTRLVKDIQAGSGSSNPKWFKAFGTRVVFAAQTGSSTTTYQLFSTNGTAAGTFRIDNVFVRSPFANLGRYLVFGGFGGNDNAGEELWRTRATAGSAERVKDIYPGFSSSQPFNLTTLRVRNTVGYTTPAACPAE